MRTRIHGINIRRSSMGVGTAPCFRCGNWRLAPGFTLLELLVTIGIIALLAAILLAVTTSVVGNAQRRQVTTAFQALEQAVTEFERSRDQKITFGRLGDPPGAYDVVELNLNYPYLMVCLLNGMDIDGAGNNAAFRPLLASYQPSLEILKRIDPSMLRKDPTTQSGGQPPLAVVPDPSTVNPNNAARLEFVDPWGTRVGVAFPGRPKVAGELGDPDGTVRTADENLLGVCRDRRIVFVSAGPDGNFGTREDNIYSYDLIWPVPPVN